MLTSPKTIDKLLRIEDIYRKLIFQEVASIPMQYLSVGDAHLRQVPSDDQNWQDAETGLAWGGPWENMWLRGAFEIPEELADQALWLSADTDAVEILVFLNQQAHGILAREIAIEMGTRGNHQAIRMTPGASVGSKIPIALECYAGHPCVGTMSFDERAYFANKDTFDHTFRNVTVHTKRTAVADFVFDLMTLNRMVRFLPESDFYRGAALHALEQALSHITQVPNPEQESAWLPGLTEARAIMAPILKDTNGPGGPQIGVVGHSHMDTAWMWTVDETIRKCARTFGSVLELMNQYDEYTFFQSAPYHLEMMRRHYPNIYERICERAREGRWQLEGGTWIEPDCNIPSGESLIRQFLWGQRYIKKITGNYSSIYWQPDVFGYNAALPQIMAGAGVKTFCTTKLSWNESNEFPYDNFQWRGIDGTEVFAHFNTTHCWPDPQAAIEMTQELKHKERHNARLVAYGYGDGGGGPMFEMLEMGRRCVDLAGVPKTTHVKAADFLEKIRLQGNHPRWQGELYLELHRGTLTSKHHIKQGNRQLEQALRDLEIINALHPQTASAQSALNEMWEILLINQFHDILPGTSLPEVHQRAEQEFQENTARACTAMHSTLGHQANAAQLSITNTLSWGRNETIELHDVPNGLAPTDVACQVVKNVCDQDIVLMHGAEIPALGRRSFPLTKLEENTASAFSWDGKMLDAPLLRLVINEAGGIESWLDKSSGREIRNLDKNPLGTLLLGEDIPALWDNWDIDADQHSYLKPVDSAVTLQVIADGPLQWRLRIERAIGCASHVRMDMIVDVHERGISYDALIDWQERHQLLKVSFPLDVHADNCRHEIQFGHVERPMHYNQPTDRSRFEVCNHRFSDVSESRFGVALFNESSYGLSTYDADLRLSLLKAGAHPDPHGDDGQHRLRFAIRAHDGFSAQNVIKPAHAFNAPVRCALHSENKEHASWLTVASDHIVVDAIKQAEDGDGYIVRLYECEGTRGSAQLQFAQATQSVTYCDYLEEPANADGVWQAAESRLQLKPFQVASLRVRF